MQTLVDYLGGWRMQFVVVVGVFPRTHIFFLKKKEVFSVHGSVICPESTSTVPYKIKDWNFFLGSSQLMITFIYLLICVKLFYAVRHMLLLLSSVIKDIIIE